MFGKSQVFGEISAEKMLFFYFSEHRSSITVVCPAGFVEKLKNKNNIRFEFFHFFSEVFRTALFICCSFT